MFVGYMVQQCQTWIYAYYEKSVKIFQSILYTIRAFGGSLTHVKSIENNNIVYCCMKEENLVLMMAFIIR